MADGRGVVGVVGDASSELAEAIEAAGARAIDGAPAAVSRSDAEAVVAVGESALTDLAAERPAVPVLPVDAGRGVRSVPSASAGEAVADLVAGRGDAERHPLLAVSVDGDRAATALFDVALVPNEAARISEYAVAAGGDRVAQFRADGVVAATAAGSTGYARRVGGPVVAPETAVLAVVPIAPFDTDPDHWILPLDELALGVERDEVGVQVLADDESVARCGVGDRVVVARDGSLDVATVAASRPRYP